MKFLSFAVLAISALATPEEEKRKFPNLSIEDKGTVAGEREMKFGAASRTVLKKAINSIEDYKERDGAFFIGVTGFSTDRDIDWSKARKALRKLFTTIKQSDANGKQVAISSGATNYGVVAVAYQVCHELNMKCIGVASGKPFVDKTLKLSSFLDRSWFIGNNWGDESPVFLQTLDVMVALGGGNQATREVASAAKSGKKVYLVTGYVGAAEDLRLKVRR